MTDRSENKPGQLIPFGKYKGQPVEAMAEDRQYCDWLAAQPWFREKYATYYQVIINNFCDPSESPEHNVLQARFLDEDFRLKFASLANPRLWWYVDGSGEMIKKAIELSSDIRNGNVCACVACLPWKHGDPDPDNSQFLLKQSTVEFEVEGVDVSWSIAAGIELLVEGVSLARLCGDRTKSLSISGHVKVEIKPEIGDDYPAILRQMRRNKSKYLFTRSYVGSSVDQPTFIQFMDSQGIRVIFEREVDAAELLVVGEFDQDAFFEAVKRKTGC